MRADRVLNRRKVAKHFTTEITDDSFRYARNQDSITAEATLDGIYVLRTSVDAGDLDSGEVVSSYKALAQVERAFRAFNTDLDIRPIRHRTEDRVRAHVFLRMLSYYITWHMQARLAPLLFTDDDKPAAQAARTSPVAPAARSPRALAKAATKHTPAQASPTVVEAQHPNRISTFTTHGNRARTFFAAACHMCFDARFGVQDLALLGEPPVEAPPRPHLRRGFLWSGSLKRSRGTS